MVIPPILIVSGLSLPVVSVCPKADAITHRAIHRVIILFIFFLLIVNESFQVDGQAGHQQLVVFGSRVDIRSFFKGPCDLPEESTELVLFTILTILGKSLIGSACM